MRYLKDFAGRNNDRGEGCLLTNTAQCSREGMHCSQFLPWVRNASPRLRAENVVPANIDQPRFPVQQILGDVGGNILRNPMLVIISTVTCFKSGKTTLAPSAMTPPGFEEPFPLKKTAR